MLTPEHAQHVIDTYYAAAMGKDREAFLALFAVDASHEDPVGGPVNHGHEDIGAFFDRGVVPTTMDLRLSSPLIVAGDEMIALLEVRIGEGAQRMLLAPVVEHFVFDDDGIIVGFRAFCDMSTITPDPE
jgi:steroid delta-isomerase